MKDKIEVVNDPERLRHIDADHQVLDCRKFKEHTDWEHMISFEVTMRVARLQAEKIKGRVFLTR